MVFVDPRVADWQSLVAGIRSDVRVVVLDSDRDALAQITQALATESNVTAIDIVSHGSQGVIEAGSSPISAATLAANAAEVGSWGGHLAGDAAIRLYGCDIGAGDKGQALISELHDLTGAQVAASTDATGGTAVGGNWVLEATTGAIAGGDPLNRTAEDGYAGFLSTPVPNAAISSSATVDKPGQTITETISFSNTGAAGTIGYNGFVDLFIPTAIKNYVTVSGSGFTTKTTTLAAGSVAGTLTFTDPLTSGTVTLTAAEATRFGVAAGDQVISVSVPVGTWTQGTPAQSFTVSVALPSTADKIAPMLGNTYYIGAVGGFQYGDTSNHSNANDWWQLGNQIATQAGNAVTLDVGDGNRAQVGVKILDVNVTVSTTPGEGETATGPDFPVTYIIDINPATVVDGTNTVTGAGGTPIDISFTLPDTVIYSGHSDNITTGGTPTVTYAATGLGIPAGDAANGDTRAPGGTIDIQVSQVTGHIREYITVYVPQYDAGNTEILASSGNSTRSVSSDATAGIAALGSPTVAGLGTGGNSDLYWNYNSTAYDLTTTLNAATVSTSGTGFTARAVAVQEGTSASSILPGQTGVTLTTNIEVSDYYTITAPTLTTTVADGLSPDLNVGNVDAIYTITKIKGVGDGTVATISVAPVLDASTGDQTMTYTAFTANLAAGMVGKITYTNTVQDTYGVQHAATYLKENDGLAIYNGANATTLGLGAYAGAADAPANSAGYAKIAGGVNRADTTVLTTAALDDSSVGESVPVGTMGMSILKINGGAPAGTPPMLSPGDTITYELTYNLKSGDYSNLMLTAYLPLPVFVTVDPNQTGVAGFTIDNGGTVLAGAGQVSGHIGLVGIGSLATDTTSAAPTIGSYSTSANNNSVTFNLGNLSDSSNTHTTNKIVIDFTVTASSQAFVGGLYLTATGKTFGDNSVATTSTAINTQQVQLQLVSPNLTVKKGVGTFVAGDGTTFSSGNYVQDGGSTTVATSSVDAAFTTPATGGGPLNGALSDVFTGGTAPSSTTSINSLLDLNLEVAGNPGLASDSVVRVVDTVINSSLGSGSAGSAYNVGLSDKLPTTYLASAGINNSGVLDFEIIRGDGTVLVGPSGVPANVTDGNGVAITSLSSLVSNYFSTGGIRLTNGGAAVLSSASTANSNLLYVVYDMKLLSSVAPNTTVLDGTAASNASVTYWTASAGGTVNFAAKSSYPQNWQDSGQTPVQQGHLTDGAILQTANYTTTTTFTEPNNAPGQGTAAGLTAAVALDGSLSLGAGLAAGVGTASATIRIPVNYRSGEDVLTFTDTAKISGSWDATSGTLTLTKTAGQSPTLTDWENALKAVKYYDTADTPNTTDRGVTIEFKENGSVAQQEWVKTSVVTVDDSPVLVDKDLSLTQTVNSGQPSGAVGTLVSTLLSTSGAPGNESDADGASAGMAIYAADTAHGSWWYSTNDGTTWTKFADLNSTTISNTNALHLLANGTTRVFFQSDAGWTGSIPTALTFRAWDASTLTTTPTANGALASIGAAGWGAGVNTLVASYSSVSDVVPVQINAVPITPPESPHTPTPPPKDPPPPPGDPTPPARPTTPLFTPPPPSGDPGGPGGAREFLQLNQNALGIDQVSPLGRPESLDLMLVASVGNKFVIPEQPATVEVPPNIFRHTNPSEPLAFEAHQPDGSPLPRWLSFDARNLTFRGTPPDSARGPVDIVIAAKDTRGAKAEAQFRILVGRDAGNDAPVQQGTQKPALPNAAQPEPGDKRSTAEPTTAERHAALDGAWFASLTAPRSGEGPHPGLAAQIQQASLAGRLAQARALARTLAG